MKRYALFFSLIAFGYILGWTSSVLRFGLSPFGSHRGPREPHGPEHMFEGIGLNDDQRAAIRKIHSEERDRNDPLHKEVEEARRNFEQVLDSTQDLPAIQQAFDRMTASKNALEQAHFNSMMKIHQVLTLEQIKKLGAKRPRGGPPPPPRD